MSENNSTEAALQAVKALHKRYWHSPGGRHYCDHCRNHVGMHRTPWPCPTMQAAAVHNADFRQPSQDS